MTVEQSSKPVGWPIMATMVGLGILPGPGAQMQASANEPERVLEVAQVKLLSEHGSTRATRYAGTSKIVTIDGKTHIAWLDSIANTMIATHDHASGQWGQAVKVGSGTDNHGGPALTGDSRGYLHIIFGPHGNVPFQHSRSAQPNDASKWIKLDGFGHHPTYPSAACDDDDSLHVIYRGGVPAGHPCKLLYQRRAKDGVWSEPRILARAPPDWKGYTHYHASITIDANQTLHVAFDLYYNAAAKHAGHIMSRDRGNTWKSADGSSLQLPASVGSDAIFATTDGQFKVMNVVCDSKGQPWISLADARSKAGPTLYHHDGNKWSSFCPAKLTVPKIPLAGMAFNGSLSIDSQDGIYLAVTLGPTVGGGSKGTVAMLYSADRGKSFQCLEVFPPDPQLPHTGLSMERPTGHGVIDTPWLLFSTGEKGPDCFGKGIFHKVHAAQFR
jgi:putative BNR repeat neuraminidase